MDESVSSLYNSLFLINASGFSLHVFLELGVLIVLLILSALISGSEVAFFSLSASKIKELSESKSKVENLIAKLLGDSKELLATILIANNFINVAVILLSALITGQIFEFQNSSFLGLGIQADYQRLFVDIGLITFMILMMGEVIPKVYATKYPLQLGLFMAKPMSILNTIFKKVYLVQLLINSTNIIDRKIKKTTKNLSVEDLSHALEITHQGEFKEEEKKILKGIVKFGKTDVKQIMSPRVDVVAVEESTNYTELMKVVVNSGYSRIPIYKESFDQVLGILYIKDLLPHLNEVESFQWQKLLREPFYVPETKKIDDLLEEFQEKKIHLAVVVDEYGGSSGIVTLEDVIEEIVGDIADEFDDEDIVYSKLDANNYVFEGKTPLNDVYRVLNIDGELWEAEKGESDSLAGFVLELFGKIPQKNERVKFLDYTFTVEAADRRRIKSVKITMSKKEKKTIASGRSGSVSAIFIGIFFSSTSTLFSCESDFTPKPRAYFRIELPISKYDSLSKGYPFSFEKSVHAVEDFERIDKKRTPNWVNIYYPRFNARIHLSYFKITEDTLTKLTEDSRTFAMKHIAKADDIEESTVIAEKDRVFGTLYDLKGSTASNYQFFLTDSAKHYVHGALYFSVRPNPDSLKPVEAFVKKDLSRLIETFKWVD